MDCGLWTVDCGLWTISRLFPSTAREISEIRVGKFHINDVAQQRTLIGCYMYVVTIFRA